MKTLGRQNPYGLINLCWLFRTDNVKHEIGSEHFVTPNSKADIFLVKERITYPHDRFEKNLISYRGRGGGGGLGGVIPPHFFEKKLNISVSL